VCRPGSAEAPGEDEWLLGKLVLPVRRGPPRRRARRGTRSGGPNRGPSRGSLPPTNKSCRPDPHVRDAPCRSSGVPQSGFKTRFALALQLVPEEKDQAAPRPQPHSLRVQGVGYVEQASSFRGFASSTPELLLSNFPRQVPHLSRGSEVSVPGLNYPPLCSLFSRADPDYSRRGSSLRQVDEAIRALVLRLSAEDGSRLRRSGGGIDGRMDDVGDSKSSADPNCGVPKIRGGSSSTSSGPKRSGFPSGSSKLQSRRNRNSKYRTTSRISPSGGRFPKLFANFAAASSATVRRQSRTPTLARCIRSNTQVRTPYCPAFSVEVFRGCLLSSSSVRLSVNIFDHREV
jgi:hypothetical protein